MKVLVSTKTTNLDVFGEALKRKIASSGLDESHLERLVLDRDYHFKCRDEVFRALGELGVEAVEVTRGQFWPDLASFQAVISIGGDGTALEASHHISDKLPLIGVKSSPMSVGHLCVSDAHTVGTDLRKFFSKELAEQEICRIQASIWKADTGATITSDPILNDFLYCSMDPCATTRYQVTWGKVMETHRSSGIWISTAAGSTAAISAAGGQVMDRSDHRFQFLVREPYYAPGSPKPSIIQGFFNDGFEIENRVVGPAVLGMDGTHGQISLGFGDKITFVAGPKLRLVYKV